MGFPAVLIIGGLLHRPDPPRSTQSGNGCCWLPTERPTTSGPQLRSPHYTSVVVVEWVFVYQHWQKKQIAVTTYQQKMNKEWCDLMRKWPLIVLGVKCRSSVQGILIRLERTEKNTIKPPTRTMKFGQGLLTFTPEMSEWKSIHQISSGACCLVTIADFNNKANTGLEQQSTSVFLYMLLIKAKSAWVALLDFIYPSKDLCGLLRGIFAKRDTVWNCKVVCIH